MSPPHRRTLAALSAVALVAGPLVTAAAAAADSTPMHTARVVARPVNVEHHVLRPYRLVELAAAISCERGEASPVAVDDGVMFCGSSADYGVAYWPAPGRHHVLCDRNPFGLRLGNAAKCTVRDGGAWGAGSASRLGRLALLLGR